MGKGASDIGKYSRSARRRKSDRRMKHVIERAVYTGAKDEEQLLCKKIQEDAQFARQFKKVIEEKEMIENIKRLENCIFHMEFEKFKCGQPD